MGTLCTICSISTNLKLEFSECTRGGEDPARASLEESGQSWVGKRRQGQKEVLSFKCDGWVCTASSVGTHLASRLRGHWLTTYPKGPFIGVSFNGHNSVSSCQHTPESAWHGQLQVVSTVSYSFSYSVLCDSNACPWKRFSHGQGNIFCVQFWVFWFCFLKKYAFIDF